MERKNYLVEELSKEEKVYFKRIVMTAKNKYIEKNYDYINNYDVSLDEVILVNEETVLDAVLQQCQEDVEAALEFEKTFSNPNLRHIVEALSLKERRVLFYLYKKQKNIKETSKIMNVDRKTVRRIRDKAQKIIAEKLVKGGY